MQSTRRYRVVHETRYEYSGSVTRSHQLAHLKPRNTVFQTVRSHRIEVDPYPGEISQGTDYFGNAIVTNVKSEPQTIGSALK